MNSNSSVRRILVKGLWALLVGVLLVSGYCSEWIVKCANEGVLVTHNKAYLGKFRKGDVVRHRFDIWNITTKPVSIGQVETTCHCSAGAVSGYRIRPLGRVSVKLIVDTSVLPNGRQSKGVLVYLANGKIVTGTVDFDVVGAVHRAIRTQMRAGAANAVAR